MRDVLVLMTADVHACGIFLGVDRVFNIFESDEAEASGFFSLLVVNKFATLEKRRNEIKKKNNFYLEFSVPLEGSSELVFSCSSAKVENTYENNKKNGSGSLPKHRDLLGSFRSPKCRCFRYLDGEADRLRRDPRYDPRESLRDLLRRSGDRLRRPDRDLLLRPREYERERLL